MSNLSFNKQPGASSLSGLLVAAGASPLTARKVNESAVVDPTTNDDSSGGYAVLSIWINTLASRAFICADASVGAAVWIQASGGSSGGVKDTISFANSFSAGQAIRRTGTQFVTAQADSAADADVLGILESVSGTDFTVVYAGRCALAGHGFTVGQTLFLSPTTPGALTETEPTTDGQISKPVAIILDANTLIVFNMRGFVVTGSDFGYGTQDISAGGTFNYTRGTQKKFQKAFGTLAAAATINLLRNNAIQGDIMSFNVAALASVTDTNNLIFQENSSGSLVTFGSLGGVACTINGRIDFAFNGTSWEIFSDFLNQS